MQLRVRACNSNRHGEIAQSKCKSCLFLWRNDGPEQGGIARALEPLRTSSAESPESFDNVASARDNVTPTSSSVLAL